MRARYEVPNVNPTSGLRHKLVLSCYMVTQLYNPWKTFTGLHLSVSISVIDCIYTLPSLLYFVTDYITRILPDCKVHGATMGPIWGRQDPCRPLVGPMSFSIWASRLLHGRRGNQTAVSVPVGQPWNIWVKIDRVKLKITGKEIKENNTY